MRSRLAYEDYPRQEIAQARQRRRLLWVGILLACVAFALSMLSGDTKKVLHTKGHLHPWLHLALFAVLGTLAVLSTLRTRTRILLVLASVALGLTIEYTEAWRFQARLEIEDILVDILGTLLGALVAWLLAHRSREVLS